MTSTSEAAALSHPEPVAQEAVAWLRTEKRWHPDRAPRRDTTTSPELADFWRDDPATESVTPLYLHPSPSPEQGAQYAAVIRWAHDTLYEILPLHYDHDEVVKLNDASVAVILELAQHLGEKHGKTDEWWRAYKAAHPSPV